jgi:hypothetical protein
MLKSRFYRKIFHFPKQRTRECLHSPELRQQSRVTQVRAGRGSGSLAGSERRRSQCDGHSRNKLSNPRLGLVSCTILEEGKG